MWCDIYPLVNILWWNLLGQWMHFIYTKVFSWVSEFYYPYLEWLLPRFTKGAPTWFTCGWAWADLWNDNLKNCTGDPPRCRPNTAFVLHFRKVAKDRYEDWVADKAGTIAGVLVDAVSVLLGSLLHGYTTFSIWIDAIRGRVGTYVPWWTTTLAAGLVWLRSKFPTAIRDATSTWDDIWGSIKTAVKDWAKARFDAAIAWLNNTVSALVTGYNTVRAWYDLVSTWVTNFKNNPVGTVVGWLGAAWTAWTGVRTGIVNFYNNVWVPFKVGLHDFLDHPVLWMEDRVTEEVTQHLGTFTRWVGPIFEKIFIWWVNNG